MDAPLWVHAINARNVDALKAAVTPDTVNEFLMVHFALWSPLQFACSRGDAASVDYLLRMGADPNLHDGRGWHALHLAASSCSSDCVRLLLQAGADVDPRNQRGRTALACAIECCNMVATRVLLDHGAQLRRVEVRVPQWVRVLAAGREHCRHAALLLVAFRRLHRSVVLESNPLDIAKLLAQNVWSMRMDAAWQSLVHDMKREE